MNNENKIRTRGRKLKTREQVRLLLAQTLRRVELVGDLGDPDIAKIVIRGAEALDRMLSAGETDARLVRIEDVLKTLIDPSNVTPVFHQHLTPQRKPDAKQ